MDKCPRCHAERKRIGVMFPARRLCNCEEGVCRECEQPAAIVEFQKPIKDNKEPALTSRQANLLCLEHRPEGFPMSATVARTEGGKLVKGKKGRLPHIDPAWETCTQSLPKGADSRQHVKCTGCGNEHELRQRVMFNGTYSYCPECNDDMYVPMWDEEDEEDPDGRERKARAS